MGTTQAHADPWMSLGKEDCFLLDFAPSHHRKSRASQSPRHCVWLLGTEESGLWTGPRITDLTKPGLKFRNLLQPSPLFYKYWNWVLLIVPRTDNLWNMFCIAGPSHGFSNLIITTVWERFCTHVTEEKIEAQRSVTVFNILGTRQNLD